MTALETSWRVYVEPRWGPVSMVHPVDVQDWGEKGVADDCVSRLLRMLRLKGHCAAPPNSYSSGGSCLFWCCACHKVWGVAKRSGTGQLSGISE